MGAARSTSKKQQVMATKKKQDEKLIKKRRIQYFVSEMDVVRSFRVDPL